MRYINCVSRNTLTLLVTLLCVTFSVPSMAASGPTALITLPNGISAEVSLPKASISADDPVLVSVKFTNSSEQTVRFLKWATPFDSSVRYDMFDIYSNGSRLPYTGVRVRRLPPTEASYITLIPGQDVDVTVDIQRAYSIEAAGSYKINYRDNQSQSAGSNSVTLVLTETRARAQRARQTAEFPNCSAGINGQMATLDSDLTDAEPIAKASYDDIQNAPLAQRASAPRYLEWFGTYSAANYEEARLTIERTYFAIRDQTIRFDCSCTDPETLAQVFPGNHYVIEICPPYYQQPTYVTASGSDSRVGTLLHEITHFAVVGDTLDTAYFRDDTLALARNNPAQAVDNADSFFFFMENNPPLSMPESGDAGVAPSIFYLLLE